MSRAGADRLSTVRAALRAGPRAAGAGELLDLGAAAARGYGQVLFCESIPAGLGLFLAFVLVAPAAAWMGAVGGGVASALARGLEYPRAEWRAGLYGYSGVLAGLYLGWLFDPGRPTWLALGAAAVLSVPLTRAAHRALTPREVPTLALPALCLVWLASPWLAPTHAAPAPAPLIQLLAGAVAVVGLHLYSRVVTLAALAGAAVGAGASLLVAGRVEPGVLANAVPAAIALGTVFLPWSAAALTVAAVGAAAAGAIWWWTAPALAAWGLSPLVAPFNAVVLLFLAALRAPDVRRRLRGSPAPLPLHGIVHPDASRVGWQARHRLRRLVRGANQLCVLTGAGVSREAGLPDVRSPGGLSSRQARITLADFLASAQSRQIYWQDEERFFRLVCRAVPATVHRALAELHRRGRLSGVVTQNVDGLHQATGVPAEMVVELHGTIHRARCIDCGLTVGRDELSERLAAGEALYCPRCQGLLKGGGVMFGEEVAPERLDAALRALLASDLLLVLGTSLAVAPATDLLRWARDAGIPIAIVNTTPTPYDALAAVTVRADAGAVLVEMLEDAVQARRP